MMLKEPSFGVEAGVICITNSYGRRASSAVIVIAAALAAVPLVRPYLPKDTHVAYEDGSAGLAVWLFATFACVSAAFWWSTVVIDPSAGEVVVRRCWGLFCSEYRRTLSSFNVVVIRADEDGLLSVYLEGPTVDFGLEFNHNKAIVWGRDKEETERIAKSVAEHLRLGVSFHREPVWPKLHV